MLLASLPPEVISRIMSWAGYLVLGGIVYGGYKTFRLMKKKLVGELATFKVIEQEEYDWNLGNLDHQRRLAVPLKPDHSSKFELEFSKFEYVADKAAVDVDGYTIYVYTPEMIVGYRFRQLRGGYAQDWLDEPISPSHAFYTLLLDTDSNFNHIVHTYPDRQLCKCHLRALIFTQFFTFLNRTRLRNVKNWYKVDKGYTNF